MKTPQVPVPELAHSLGFAGEIWFKREDLHHHGSHKGRSLPLMIDDAVKLGFKKFVISSSGNAALSAAISIQNHNKNKPTDPFFLHIYVGKNVDPHKYTRLKNLCDEKYIILNQVDNAKQSALVEGHASDTKLLRQSTEDTALRGYYELARELNRIEGLTAIFLPASSGTTTQGLAEGFQKIEKPCPALHIAQTPNCHPLVAAVAELKNQPIAPTPESTQPSLAQAIVDHIAHRKETVAKAVVASQGDGWVISNEEIKAAIALVKKTTDIDLSPTSALSVAALMRALKNHRTFSGAVVCIITGN